MYLRPANGVKSALGGIRGFKSASFCLTMRGTIFIYKARPLPTTSGDATAALGMDSGGPTVVSRVVKFCPEEREAAFYYRHMLGSSKTLEARASLMHVNKATILEAPNDSGRLRVRGV